MSAAERPQVRVDQPDEGDLQRVVRALNGIFWALDMLVTHHAVDDISHDEDRITGIEQLLLAGKLITEQTGERF